MYLDLSVRHKQLLMLLWESGATASMIHLIPLFKDLLHKPKPFELGELKRPQPFHWCGKEILVQVVCLVVCNLAVLVSSVG